MTARTSDRLQLAAKCILATVALVTALYALRFAGAAHAAPSPSDPPVVPLAIHPSAAQSAADGPRFDGETWNMGESVGVLRYPIALEPGNRIVAWTLHAHRDSFTPLGPVLAARLERMQAANAPHEGVGMGVTDTRKEPGPVTLHVALDPPHIVDGAGYSLMVAGNGVPGDRVGVAVVHVARGPTDEPVAMALVPAAPAAKPSDALRDPLDDLGGAIDDVSAARRHGWALGALVGLILISRSLSKARKRWPESRALAWMGGRVGGVVIGVGVVGSSAFDAIALGGSWVAAAYAAIGAALYLLMPELPAPAPSSQRQPERGAASPLLVILLGAAVTVGATAAWSCAPLRSAGREGAPVVVDCTLVSIGEHADDLEAAIRDATNLDGSIDWTRIRAAVRDLGEEVGGCALRAAIGRILGAQGVQAQSHPSEAELRAGWERVRVEVLGGRRYLPEVR